MKGVGDERCRLVATRVRDWSCVCVCEQDGTLTQKKNFNFFFLLPATAGAGNMGAGSKEKFCIFCFFMGCLFL